MEIKGVAVKTISDFVKGKFPERYDEWISALPQPSKEIFNASIIPSHWYQIDDAAVMPTQLLGQMFYGNNDKQAAWESGRYGAEIALQGIYRFFVKATSPSFIISRANKVFSTYYQPCAMNIVKNEPNEVIVHITDFEKPIPLVEYRIAGWIEKALEISGCKGVVVMVTKSLSKGHPYTELHLQWN